MKNLEKQSQYSFKILWSKTYVGIAINQNHKENFDVPLTTFYFWPREEGWKLLKAELDSKPWMDNYSKIEILNGYTTIIKYWQENISKTSTKIIPNKEKLGLNVEILAINSIN
jgi:30S ribosomal protein 3